MEGLSLQKVEVICLSDFLCVYQLGRGVTNILVQLAPLQRVCSMLPTFPPYITSYQLLSAWKPFLTTELGHKAARADPLAVLPMQRRAPRL